MKAPRSCCPSPSAGTRARTPPGGSDPVGFDGLIRPLGRLRRVPPLVVDAGIAADLRRPGGSRGGPPARGRRQDGAFRGPDPGPGGQLGAAAQVAVGRARDRDRGARGGVLPARGHRVHTARHPGRRLLRRPVRHPGPRSVGTGDHRRWGRRLLRRHTGAAAHQPCPARLRPARLAGGLGASAMPLPGGERTRNGSGERSSGR